MNTTESNMEVTGRLRTIQSPNAFALLKGVRFHYSDSVHQDTQTAARGPNAGTSTARCPHEFNTSQ
jgi:hypothetical protein